MSRLAILSLCLGFLAFAPAGINVAKGHDFTPGQSVFYHGDGGGP